MLLSSHFTKAITSSHFYYFSFGRERPVPISTARESGEHSDLFYRFNNSTPLVLSWRRSLRNLDLLILQCWTWYSEPPVHQCQCPEMFNVFNFLPFGAGYLWVLMMYLQRLSCTIYEGTCRVPAMLGSGTKNVEGYFNQSWELQEMCSMKFVGKPLGGVCEAVSRSYSPVLNFIPVNPYPLSLLPLVPILLTHAYPLSDLFEMRQK